MRRSPARKPLLLSFSLVFSAAAALHLFASLPAWAAWVISANAVAFVMYGWDKRAAKRSAQRIPEWVLLAVSLPLAAPGAFAAQELFRHKTRKLPFRFRFALVAVVQFAGLALWLWYFLSA